MAEVLVLKVADLSDPAADWIVVDSSGARLGPPVTGPLSAARIDVGERRLIVLLPAADVLTTSLELPVKSPAKIQQALPFALEEYLADDVEDLHFAAGTRRESGKIPVSVIKRRTLESWLEKLSDAGLKPDALLAETYGLARIPGTISLLIAKDQVFINDGADTELVLQGVRPAEALAAIGAMEEELEERENAEQTRAPRHVLAYCEPGSEETYAHDFVALRHDFDSVDVKVLPDGVLPRLAVTAATGAGVNLLQGEFGARTEYASLLRPWRQAAMLLLALGAIGIAAKAIDYVKLSRQEAGLREQFLAEYREIAPGTDDVRDPVAVISSLRARAGAGGGAPTVFLQSLEQLSKAIEQHGEASIQAISYRAGVVDVRLSAPSVSVLDNIQRSIDQGGSFEAEIQSTDQDGDKVNSRIQIQASGP